MLISLDYPLHSCVQHQFKPRPKASVSLYLWFTALQKCSVLHEVLHELESELMIDLTYLRVEKIFKDQNLFEVILLS